MEWPEPGNGSHEPAEPPDAGALKSWLMRGTPASSVDPRRRTGRNAQARRLLAVDAVWVASAQGAWRGLVSALQRHTVHDALAKLRMEDRHILTLAFLQGHTNEEIGQMLQVSVRTVGRRLAAALERLEEQVRKAGIWVVSLALAIFLPLIRQERWPQVVTVAAAGAAAAVSIGLVALSPDTVLPGRAASPPATQSVVSLTPPLLGSQVQSSPATTTVTADQKPGKVHAAGPSAAESDNPNVSSGANGCHGNVTGAPPPVPVGPRPGHATEPPVDPPRGGCKAT
jgi:hypothetical protein